MVADCSTEEMQASEERTPLRDFKGSDDEGSAESEKNESEPGDSDSSEGELDTDETTAGDGKPNDNAEQATEGPYLRSPAPGDCSTEDTTTINPPDSDFYIKAACPSCNSQMNQNFEQITPRQISKERFCLKLDHEGSYQCVATGLIFEVTEKVDIIYSILSWYKYDTFLPKKNWKLCGPLFDVKSDPALLKSIYFPHSLCLADHSPDLKFGILHVKNKKSEIEPTTDHSTTHVQWNVSSLSPVGPVFQPSSEDVQHHGVVLIYKIINTHQSLLFHVYMAANNDSIIKDISKDEKHSKQKSVKIDKPTPCHKKLIIGKTYRLLSDPQAEIFPGEITFADMSLLKCKGYFEVYLEQPEDLQLTLKDIDSGETMWTSKLRECDWSNYNQNEEGKQRDMNKNKKRKSTNDSFMEETSSKKPRWNDTTDGLTCKKDNIITDKQLMQFAEKLGSNWKVIAISCLDLQSQDINEIKDKNESLTMQKFQMLEKWKNKELDNATPSNLRKKLMDANIEYEAWNILEGFCNQVNMHEEHHK
ncbi:uncharacterized protein si:dkeyp-97b10.3 isoform X2 [Heterodontus francisci]|uniref:uncharacterized protein si:dkeyp-97b10.3 isoform X2 n=1 Tax=Heterodontus francisci TaxID=7792 RepID=UPI00355BD874